MGSYLHTIRNISTTLLMPLPVCYGDPYSFGSGVATLSHNHYYPLRPYNWGDFFQIYLLLLYIVCACTIQDYRVLYMSPKGRYNNYYSTESLDIDSDISYSDMQRTALATIKAVVTGLPLSWCGGYLSGRQQKDVLIGTSFALHQVASGIYTSWSILGPLLFHGQHQQDSNITLSHESKSHYNIYRRHHHVQSSKTPPSTSTSFKMTLITTSSNGVVLTALH